jgi:hypothetical protein
MFKQFATTENESAVILSLVMPKMTELGDKIEQESKGKGPIYANLTMMSDYIQIAQKATDTDILTLFSDYQLGMFKKFGVIS